MSEELNQAIATIKRYAARTEDGLPEDLFLLVSQLTPLINVDLLIKNEAGQILLTWRDDEYYGSGWHVPGGIIRFKEQIEDRIIAVGQIELQAKVRPESQPVNMQTLLNPTRDVRGHFISLLYECHLESPLNPAQRFTPDRPVADQWEWHDVLPDTMIAVHHKMYGYLFDQ